MIKISFPGIGIDEFSIDPVALDFGKLQIRWYAICITVGMILAIAYCMYRAKQEGIKMDDLYDMAIFGILFGVIGARAYYVLMSLDKYDSFLETLYIWEGGLAIYGGIIAGGITVFVVCRLKKINPLKALDMVAPAVMIGQILGRWGNFFNGEAYGIEVAENSIFYFIRMGLLPNIDSYFNMHYYHPTFLYESIWNLVGFILINLFYKKKKFSGQIFYMYIVWYGFGRMFIEGLRTDSLYIGVFRVSQIVAFICVVAGSILLVYNFAISRRKKLTSAEYEPAYPKFSRVFPVNEETTESETEVDAEEDNTEAGEASEPEAKSYKINNSVYTSEEDKLKDLFNDKEEKE